MNAGTSHRPFSRRSGQKGRTNLPLKRKLSQEKLAELSGMHVTYLGRIERGGQNISLANIEKLARGLRVKPGDLFKGIR